MDKKTADKHSVCLIGMFILGETLIFAPFSGADSFNILALIAASSVAAAVLYILAPLVWRVFAKYKDNDNKRAGALSVFCYSIAIIFSLYVAFGGFNAAVTLAEKTMLNNMSRIVIAILLSAVAIVAALGLDRVIYKVALIFALIAAVIVAVLFALCLPQYEIRNIVPYNFSLGGKFWLQAVDYFIRAFLPSILAVVYICLTRENSNGKTVSEGVFLGASLLIICIASAIMIFKAPTAAQMQFPYLSAVGTANVGELFTRADGLAYPLLTVTALIRITVCLKNSLILLGLLGFKYKKSFAVACGLLMPLLAII